MDFDGGVVENEYFDLEEMNKMLSCEFKQINKRVYSLIESKLYDLGIDDWESDKLWMKLVQGEAHIEKINDYKYKISYVSCDWEKIIEI